MERVLIGRRLDGDGKFCLKLINFVNFDENYISIIKVDAVRYNLATTGHKNCIKFDY